VWCVFGCGGDRDRTKRRIMGRIAEEGADFVIVTDDNPRTEPSEDIFAEIREGFQSPTAAFWISDRAEAIEMALSRADASDIVVVAGKGHESYQVQGAKRIDFDDREVIRETWKRLRAQRKRNEI
jgi:UDP-N-acetylmuramoyl-L-alanyl-D-glutamate--2,6-diaminopimelate ligase